MIVVSAYLQNKILFNESLHIGVMFVFSIIFQAFFDGDL